MDRCIGGGGVGRGTGRSIHQQRCGRPQYRRTRHSLGTGKFEGLNPGDSAYAENLINLGGGGTPNPEDRQYLINDDNPDLGGNHFDGDSAGAGGWSGFDINHWGYVADQVYVQGIFNDHGRNFSPGVLNSAGNTQFLVRYIDGHWELIGIQDSAHSGPNIFDPSLPTVVTNVATLDGGFVLDISTTVYQPDTGTSWAHTATNTIPGFGTPSWSIFYDRRGTPTQNVDFDDLIIASYANPFIPEPTTIALLLASGLLVLRPRRRA